MKGISKSRNQAFWMTVLVTSILAVILGFGLNGGTHGLYSDDYAMKAWALDLETGHWKLQLTPMQRAFRSLHSLISPNFVNAIPDHELVVRLLWLLVHCVNAALIGGLAWRLVRTRLAFIVATWLYLVPLIANEAVLWHTANTAYLPSMLVTLMGVHAYLFAAREWHPALLLTALISLGVSPLFCEALVGVAALIPFVVMTVEASNRTKGNPVVVLARALTFSAVVYAGYGLYWQLVLRHAPNVAARGGFTLDPWYVFGHRIPEVLRGVLWLLTSWGLSGPLAEAFRLGLGEWLSSVGGGLLLGLLAASLVFSVAAYSPSDERRFAHDGRRTSATFLIGLAWAMLTLLPLVLVKSQIVEVRTLYAPWAGIAIAAAALLQKVVDCIPRHEKWVSRLVLALSGLIMGVSSLAMAGVVRAYQLRWDLDQRQVHALRSAIPSLPRMSPIWVLPVALDERCVSHSMGQFTLLDRYLFGVFETPWSAAAALRMEYRRPDIFAVAANRWDRLHLTDVTRTVDGTITEITVQDTRVPIDHILAFTYQQGHIVLLDPLLITLDHDQEITVDLPLAAEVQGPNIATAPFELALEEP